MDTTMDTADYDTPESDSTRTYRTSKSRYSNVFDSNAKHQTTDCCCAVIFLICLTVWIVLGAGALRLIDIKTAFNPKDSYGNICGSENLEDRPYLFYFDIHKCGVQLYRSLVSGCDTPMVCVKECPTKTFNLTKKLNNGNLKSINLNKVICKYNEVPTLKNLKELVDEDKCAGKYIESFPLFGRCFPRYLYLPKNKLLEKEIDSITNSSRGLLKLFKNQNFAHNIWHDISQGWKWIVGIIIFGTWLSVIWIMTMHLVVRTMLWVAIIAVMVLSPIFFLYSLNKYREIKALRENETNISSTMNAENILGSEDELKAIDTYIVVKDQIEGLQQPNWTRNRSIILRSSDLEQTAIDYKRYFMDHLNRQLQYESVWFGISVACCVSFFLLIILVIVLGKRIYLAVKVVEEVSKAMSQIQMVMLYPVLPLLLKLVTIVLWLAFMLAIFGVGREQYRTPNYKICNPLDYNVNVSCKPTKLVPSNIIAGAQIYNLLMLFWVLEFFGGLYYVTLGMSFSSYYWATDRQEIPLCLIVNSMFTALFRHTGSIALGSAILSFFGFFRILIAVIRCTLSAKCNDQEASCIESSANLCCCCLRIFDWIVRYINNYTYIMVAIKGRPYCESATEGMQLLTTNPLRTMILNVLMEIYMILSKIAITGITAMFAYFIFSNSFPMIVNFEHLNSKWTPIVFCTVITFVISSIYLSVYQVAADTLFLCYLIDLKMNDGRQTRPHFLNENTRLALERN